MSTVPSAILWIVGAFVGVNLLVSVIVLRSPFYSATQKLVQCIIVWLVPVLGAVGVWAFLRVQYNWQKYDTRAFPERSQKMVAVEISNSIQESGGHGGSD